LTTRKAWIALAAVCFFWGTTYIGIRMALEGLSPQYLVAVRFLLSGSLILLWAWWKRWNFPKGRELGWAFGTGLLTLGVGNYFLSLAETYIESGLAALIITIAPFWMVGAEALIPGGAPVKPKAFLGMLVGFVGAIWLIGPEGFKTGLGGATVKGFLVLQLSCLGWSVGSILQKRRKSGANPILVGGIQQLSAGLAATLVCVAFPGWRAEWSPAVLGAVLYLAFFGSIVAYSAYLMALEGLPVAIVSIYTYVNPIVAVCLGWLIYRERIGVREVGAMCVIFLGVFLVNHFSKKP
jgi:drug/metabolite transporter (DMT)-like permease